MRVTCKKHMTKPQSNTNTTSYSRDLLSHAAGVTGRMPDKLKQVNQAYVHEHSTTTTVTTVDLGQDPVDSAVELVTDVDRGTVCEICLETQDAAAELMDRLVDYPSVLVDVIVEIYYCEGDAFERFRLVPHRSRSSSLVRAAETFSDLFTVSNEVIGISESEEIEVMRFVERFETWYHNMTGSEPTKPEIGEGLHALFGQPLSELSTTSSHGQPSRDTIPRRWIEELHPN